MTESKPSANLPWSAPLKPQIEAALDRFLPPLDAQPEALHRAMRYAVFADGKRLRPQFLLHVTQACGAGHAEVDLAMRAACAVELIHIASQVHDDLPCFDNAYTRRGRMTVHVLFSEARALLVGDALLAQSFELLTNAGRAQAARTLRITQLLARATGSTSGLIAGQGLEHDHMSGHPATDGAESYHIMKTGALFGMAAEAGAVAAGARKTESWARIGWLVGRGYQLAHALQTPTNPGAFVVSNGSTSAQGSAAPRPETPIQRQLRALADRLHTEIQGLAPHPAPLLDFLDSLCLPLLQPGTAASASPGQATTPAEERQRRTDSRGKERSKRLSPTPRSV